jgi:hypothetical protein
MASYHYKSIFEQQPVVTFKAPFAKVGHYWAQSYKAFRRLFGRPALSIYRS